MLLTLIQLQERIGCSYWSLRRLFDDGIVKPTQRAGRVKLVHEDRVAEIRQVLMDHGCSVRSTIWKPSAA